MERKFSFIYSEIIADENDMIGHVAYSLYKSNKIKYIEQFKDKNGGKPPNEEELNAFHDIAKTTLPALKVQAEQILSNFTQYTLEGIISDIEQEVKINQEEILQKIITPIIPSKVKGPWDGFWMAVLVKGTQTLVVALIFFLVIFGFSAKDDFWGTIRKLLPESKKQTELINTNSSKKDSTNQ